MSIGLTMTRASAAGAFAFTSNVAVNDTVTIGGIVYTFVAVPASANEVDVGVDLDTSISNLVAAINDSGVEGSTYGTGTVENPSVSATADLANDEIDLAARFPGAEGDGIYLASTSPGANDITAGGVRLGAVSGAVAGAGSVEDWLESLVALNQVNSEVLSEFNDVHRLGDL